MSDLSLTAIHEAGHVVAVILRGGNVDAITIDPGSTTYTVNRAEWPFVAYAGPWAQARYLWARDPSRPFSDHLEQCVAEQSVDRERFLGVDTDGWAEELERQWPVMVNLSNRLVRAHADQRRRANEKRRRTLDRRSSRYRYQALRRQRMLRERETAT